MENNNLLHVALIQMDIVWENPQANREELTEKINSLKHETDLVILPEMFITGFTMNTDLSETMDGETVSWMKKIASENDFAITGSIIIKDSFRLRSTTNTQELSLGFAQEPKFYNRLLFVHPDGKVETYDKRHSFTLANEHKTYTSGSSKLIVEYKGWKICPLICYDLRFPVWSRNTENYDLLIYTANWPEKRVYAWDSLLKARAIENLSYTIGVNRVGEDGKKYSYVGHSVVLDFLGKLMSEVNCTSEKIIEVVLDKSMQNKQRARYGFLDDMDSFEIK